MSGPQVIRCEQGSEEWYRVRAGMPTASEFHTILAQPRPDGTLPQPIMDAMVKSGCTAAQLAAAVKAARKKYSNVAQTRRTYMLKLAGEVLTGEPMDSYSNGHMERGKVMEDEARELYAFLRDVDPDCVGFIINGGKGCSPDCLIGADGMAEVKTKLPHLQIDVLLRGELPAEHKAQCQGGLWVAEREWIDFVSYWPTLPLFVKRIHRDEAYIKEIAAAVDQFNNELAEMVATIRCLSPARERMAA